MAAIADDQRERFIFAGRNFFLDKYISILVYQLAIDPFDFNECHFTSAFRPDHFNHENPIQ